MNQAKRTGLYGVEENGKAICHVVDETARYGLSEVEECPKSVSNCEAVNGLIQKTAESHGHRKHDIVWN